MLTPYGKLVRKHRIDAGMTLREMATALGITPAFLSAVETGRKSVPAEMPAKVAALMELDMAEQAELQKAAELSRKDFRVRLNERATGDDREVAAMFARQFPELSEEEKEEIRKILEGRRA